MQKQKRYGILIDLNRCIGCFACQVTCKAEYDIPYGSARCRVETYRSGTFPHNRKLFLPRICNHCDNAPCIEACEEQALRKNHDGIVVVNDEQCTGCELCFQKCPYQAIGIIPYTGKAEKCDFCYSRRIVEGRQPVCVESCMGKAMVFGNMNDDTSDIAIRLKQNELRVLRPELGTRPSVFYILKHDTGNTPLGSPEKRDGPRTSRVSIPVAAQVTEREKRIIYTSDAMCPSECGISVLVENGVAKKIYGNPHALINTGAFCAKGASGLQLTYSPYRIRTPLMRAGLRGEDRWKEVSWREAADHIAIKLIEIKKRYGPEAVFFDGGDVTDRDAFERLFHAFGTPNIYNHGSICDPNRRWGHRLMLGDERPLPDIQRPLLTRNTDGRISSRKDHDARLILNIGVNPFVATRFNYMSSGIPAAQRENRCMYIVIDPSHTNSAARADMWLPIRPGTDPALLGAMLYYIIKNDSLTNQERRYIDHDFLKHYTNGWEEFRKAFLKLTREKDPSNGLYRFTPEWAEEKTGIAKKDIERIAHLFGITKPASIEIGMHGTAHHTNGDVTSILMTALCLVTGNMDRPGGLVFIDSQKVKKNPKTGGKGFLAKSITRDVHGTCVSGTVLELHKDHYGDFPAAWRGVLSDLPQKIRDGIQVRYGSFKGYRYPVKAFITRAGNPAITAGCTSDWTDALTSRDKQGNYLLDLMVFIDTHITITGTYADIVLPEAGFLERMGLSDVYTMNPEVAIRDKVINPLHDSKTPFEIMITLAKALTDNKDPDIREEDFSGKYCTEEDFINELLSTSPGFFNIGKPLPYPDIPEGALIRGVPDNPIALVDGIVVKKGEPLTVQWLRDHHGVAAWPAGYERFKRSDGTPSGIYPQTSSRKFEFRFRYLENLNRRLGTHFPVTFYWSECQWNPKSSSCRELSEEYPFQLVSGRSHYSMTMTAVCPYLAETETECMKPCNADFQFRVPDLKGLPNTCGFPENEIISMQRDSVSIPVLAFFVKDGERLGLKTGDLVMLINPLGRSTRGKVFLTEEVMPGVIKTAFGTGGQKAAGTGFLKNTAEYTPNINELMNPENLSPYTGMPGFGDIMVKVVKVKSEI